MTEDRSAVDRPVALVTGATGGMGGEIVRDLLRTHRVVAVGRDTDALDALAALGAEPWQVDVTDAAALAARTAALARLDVLVHAAATGGAHSVADATEEDWLGQLAVNVVAPATLTRLVLPLLRAASGTVVFIGSGAGTRPVPGSAVYTASKHALRGLADVLRIDEEPHRVRVVTIAPGQTDTAMPPRSIAQAGGVHQPERYIAPGAVASVVRFVVDAPPDTQLTDIAVRPRQEIARL